MSIFFWQGTLVKLRAIEPSDWEHHFDWDKDSEMMRQVDRLFAPRSQEATRQWAEKMSLRAGTIFRRVVLRYDSRRVP